MPRLKVLAFLLIATSAMTIGEAFGQDYPQRPIRIIAAGPGGGTDYQARLLAQGLSGNLGQVVVENRPSGQIPNETVARAAPDGYTLLLTPGGLWLGPFLGKVPYDPIRDFVPITLAARAPTVLVVNMYLPIKSVRELIALAKARPGELNYTSGGSGGTGHLAPELFKAMTGTNIVRVAYKNGALEISDLISGEAQLSFGTAAAVMPQVKGGKLRALAVSSLQPSPLVPGLPTLAEAVPGFETGSIFGLFAPAKTPDAIIRRLNQEAVRFLNTKEAKERYLQNAGAETVGSNPEEFVAVIKSEMAKWGKLIRDAGIKAD